MELALLGLAAVAMGVGWWWLGRRRKQLLGDSDDPASLLPGDDPGPPEVLSREALLGRSKAFDPSAWDDSPDGGAAGSGEPEDLPSRFDRSYLERTSRRPADDSAAPAADPAPPADSAASPPAPRPSRAVATPDDPDEDLPRYFDREYLERRSRAKDADRPDEPA